LHIYKSSIELVTNDEEGKGIILKFSSLFMNVFLLLHASMMTIKTNI